MKKIRRLIVSFGSVVLLMATCTVRSDSSLERGDQLKAVYLFNFTKYIRWPDSSFESKSEKISICVDAPAVFREFLGEIINDKRVGKAQQLLEVVSLDVAVDCELIYLVKRDNKLPITFNNSVIVTDSGDNYFPETEIKFYILDKKLRFEIDLDKFKKKNITVSSELLKLAKIK